MTVILSEEKPQLIRLLLEQVNGYQNVCINISCWFGKGYKCQVYDLFLFKMNAFTF